MANELKSNLDLIDDCDRYVDGDAVLLSLYREFVLIILAQLSL